MSNFSNKLRQSAKNLRSLKQKLLEQVRIKIELDLIQTFHAESDPNNVKWKERKHDYPWKINNHSGNLDFSRQVDILMDSISISYNTDYAKYVNNVRTIIPKTVPEHWLKIFEIELDKLLKEI